MAAQLKYNPEYHDDWAWSLAIKGATDKEIADAVKTLAKIGFSPANVVPQNYAMMAGYNNNIDYELLPMLMNRGMGNAQNLDHRALQNYLTSGMLQGLDMGFGQGRGL